MLNNVTIRRTQAEDAAQLARLFAEGSAQRETLQLPHVDIARWQERLAKVPANVYSFVAEVDGKIVGNIGFTVEALPRRAHVASFGMGVNDQFQGQGIGSALMAAMIDMADNWLNVHRIELTVFSDNHKAQQLYQKFGFVTEGESRDYAFRDGDYVDALHMARINPNH